MRGLPWLQAGLRAIRVRLLRSACNFAFADVLLGTCQNLNKPNPNISSSSFSTVTTRCRWDERIYIE
ncbi:hypothetical protein GOBAR_AA26407 [Gossypium barbadense]|uniref:Uncharacterized protein n=1 Tax=Gossypium barbadense TaxID=3634 RepID=A0A2P5WT42_GOSBA|nr:hypothetical protein GOBAR_AA26407 [Gossypium barbadense]